MKRKPIYIIIVIILVFGILSCNHKQKRDEMVLQSMSIATMALEKHSEKYYHFVQISSVEYPERTKIIYEKIMKANSFSKSFKEAVLRNESYDRLKLLYATTMDSLSGIFDTNKTEDKQYVKKYYNEESFNLMVDSTLNFYTRNETFRIQKMQYDIAMIFNKISEYLICQIEASGDFFENGKSQITPLKPKKSVNRNYTLLIYGSKRSSMELNVLIDNITYNNKETVPYHLYQNVSLLSFDSTLQSGYYDIYGKILYKLNDAPASFVEKKVRHTVKVD